MVGESMSGWQSGNGIAEGVLTEERPGTTHPDGLVDEQRRRRRAAEAAADAADAAAAEAAARASAAIAAAAAAAADAEAAADLAARAAADAESAAADERRAVERAHALTAVSANETTTVALSPVSPVNGSPGGSPNGVRPARHRPSVPVQALPPDEAAVARAATMTIPATPLRTASAPATGGRAARRRAQEAAEAAAAVSREANRDPDTHVFTVDREPEPAAPSRRRRSAAPTGWSPAALLARLRGRPSSRMVLVAGAVGGVILVAALVAGLVGGSRGASTAAVVQAAPGTTEAAAPTSAAADPGAAADPTSTKAVAYLKALRAADVPTSDSGRSETEAAEVICQQLANGAQAADLVRALPAVLPTVNSKQAKSVVSIAQKDYCS